LVLSMVVDTAGTTEGTDAVRGTGLPSRSQQVFVESEHREPCPLRATAL